MILSYVDQNVDIIKTDPTCVSNPMSAITWMRGVGAFALCIGCIMICMFLFYAITLHAETNAMCCVCFGGIASCVIGLIWVIWMIIGTVSFSEGWCDPVHRGLRNTIIYGWCVTAVWFCGSGAEASQSSKST
jgi:hypothetical protein